MKRITLPLVLSALVALSSHGATYTYTNATSSTTEWSAGTDWDAGPVSAADTILILTNDLASGTAVVSDNDIAGNFLLNRLDFRYRGPNSGSVPTVTLTGNPLEFTGANAQIYYLPATYGGTASTYRPGLTIQNSIVLSSDLTVYGMTQGPTPLVTLAGAISGSYRVQFQGNSGQHTSYMLSNPGNSYTGDTRVYYSSSSGRDTILRLGASDVIPNGVGYGDLYLLSPGEAGRVYVQLYGHDETVNGLLSSFPTGANGPAAVHAVQNGAAAAATLTVGDADATALYYGTIQNYSSGSLSLRKIGTGTQTLAGLSTHTGTTTIDGGTIKVDYTLLGTSRTASPANAFSSASGLVLAGGTTFAIAGREDGGAYYQASYTSPAYNRVLNLPNADVATLVVGQPVTLTKIGGSGVLGAAGDSYYVQAIGTPGATTTPVYMNARVVSASGVIISVDIPSTVATTTQAVASLTLSGAAGSEATLDFGSSDNVTLTFSAAPVQNTDGSKLAIVNWNGTPQTGGGDDRLIFTGAPSGFSSVFSQSEVVFDGYGPGYALVDLGGSYEVTARLPAGGTLMIVY